MQGVVFMHQQGSPPPNNTSDMEVSPSPMNYSTKEKRDQSNHDSGIFSTTNNSIYDVTENHSRMTQSENSPSENGSDCSDRFSCPICSTVLTTQHDFTLHIKSHNCDNEPLLDDKGFTCRICFKVLSSSSSLDRHVLVHSGERPFHCKYCGDTFTTNGNMHRHMRAHSIKSKNYESDGSTDSSTSNTEYNNNRVRSKLNRKRKLETDEEDIIENKRFFSQDDRRTYRCPVCERNDFETISVLENHMEDNHPDYPAKCHQCGNVFLNQKQLEIHRVSVHDNVDHKHPVVGFKDLTFVDFSSEKFPHIARYECEKNLHKVSGSLKFQCKKCNRAFPCSSSLEFHEKDCKEINAGLDLSAQKLTEVEVKRNDFFSRLNLQDVSPEKHIPSRNDISTKNELKNLPDNNKDLADIQTIISMTTSGSLLQQLQHKTNELTNNLQKSHSEIQPENSKNEEEETQDAFAVEFRKMKLKGEFPCRLCTAIFPNLRALKGHNRAHLNGNNNGSYRCNMCPHSSVDKAALIRHMRTHNGDRPYECSLCNYAFTTKANCERHLRNRHAKTTREEVKKAIIYHPSEDPTNDEITKLSSREDNRKLNNSSSEIFDTLPDKIHCSTPKFESRPLPPELKHIPTSERNPLIPNLHSLTDSLGLTMSKEPIQLFPNMNDVIRNENLKAVKDYRNIQNNPMPPSPYLPPYGFQPSTGKIQVKDLNALKVNPYENNSEEEEYEEDDEYIDVVLDLSKKKPTIEEAEKEVEESPQDLSLKPSPSPPEVAAPVAEILQANLLKTQPKIDPAAFYAHWALLRNGFAGLPSWPSFPFNPLFLQQLQSQIPTGGDMKDRLRNQLCGGTLIADNRLQALQQIRNAGLMPIPMNNIGNETRQEVENSYVAPTSTEDLSRPLSLKIEQNMNENVSKMTSPLPPCKQDIMQSPNSVKMVIKNGILMPKQKQRRYRTERPFTCEHCSARFTLRSNMERHIKQQHPQFWSQRQRGNIGHPGRKSQVLPMKPGFCDLSIPNYEIQKNQGYEDKEMLSDRLKFAILAQHLRGVNNFNNSVKKEEDEEDALVIDENSEDKPSELQTMNDSYEKEYQEEIGRSESENEQRSIEHKTVKLEESQDLVPVSRLLDNASQQQFNEYFKRDVEENGAGSEEDEEGLVASGSTSEGNISGTDENKSESENTAPVKKKSAYSLAPNRVSCPYCSRKFPWTSSLRRHILTHTGQKPFKCSHCPLLFTTKSNCDRHLLRKHGNAATTITNDVANNNANYLMRNVPERPFKCSSCPSSTFSTYTNLKKHISSKHATNAQGDDIRAQGYEAGSSEDEKVVNVSDNVNEWNQNQNLHAKMTNQEPLPSVVNADQPFKCHLCEFSFGERQEALDHIKEKHASEYDLLMSKNALDSSATTPEESTHNDEEDSEIRGKFPDYSNRKVICAFCMRRFWSAEDLRRHMRTHTGERPFMCDICRRRFTLKHSMLRHRKKHNVNFDNDVGLNSDEEGVSPKYEAANTTKRVEDSDGANEAGDLISNLLGIRPSFIDKVLTASADDAAKLLGVRNGVKE